MFLIFGLKSRRSTVGRGSFRCPNEGGTRDYEHLQAKRWFSVWFVPLIPLGTQGEWVRCRSCGATYGLDVLDRHPVAD